MGNETKNPSEPTSSVIRHHGEFKDELGRILYSLWDRFRYNGKNPRGSKFIAVFVAYLGSLSYILVFIGYNMVINDRWMEIDSPMLNFLWVWELYRKIIGYLYCYYCPPCLQSYRRVYISHAA